MDSSMNPGLHFDIPQKHLCLLFHTDREQVDEGDVLSRDIDPNKYLASTVLCCLRWGYYGPWQVLFIGCWRAEGKNGSVLCSSMLFFFKGLEMNSVVVSSEMALLPPLNPSNGPASSRFSAGRPWRPIMMAYWPVYCLGDGASSECETSYFSHVRSIMSALLSLHKFQSGWCL